MFSTEVKPDGGLPTFILQQLAVCCASMLWAAATVWLPMGLSGMGGLGKMFEASGVVALAMGPAFLCGRAVKSKFPKFEYSGRWVWLLPSALLAAMLVSFAFSSRLEQNVAELFFPPPEGEAWWGVLIFTYPTLGCVGYSLGIGSEAERARE
jgi:hypothetical protein